jgi:hypothetical protein
MGSVRSGEKILQQKVFLKFGGGECKMCITTKCLNRKVERRNFLYQMVAF